VLPAVDEAVPTLQIVHVEIEPLTDKKYPG